MARKILIKIFFSVLFPPPTHTKFIIVYGLINYEPLKYHDYEYPMWVNYLGLLIASSSILCIPITAIWMILITSGSLKEVIITLDKLRLLFQISKFFPT